MDRYTDSYEGLVLLYKRSMNYHKNVVLGLLSAGLCFFISAIIFAMKGFELINMIFVLFEVIGLCIVLYLAYINYKKIVTIEEFYPNKERLEMIKKECYYFSNAEKFIEISKNYDMTKFYGFCEELFEKYNVKKVCDLAFGSGRDMRYFRNKGYTIHGYDNCERFIKHAREEFNLNVTLKQLPYGFTIEDFDYPQDAFYCVGLLEHLTKKERYDLFYTLKNLLVENGLFIVSYNELDRENDKERLFYNLSKKEIEEYCNEIGFEIVKSETMVDTRGITWYTEAFKKVER